jgi:hypothetical protein
MMKYIIVLSGLFILFFLSGCKDKTVDTYQNDMGIDPAAIADIDSANYTTIEWIDTVKNFGVIKQGDTAFIDFRFRNTGKTALFITRVEPSCGCTSVTYTKGAILPGKEGKVTGLLATLYYPGYANKAIRVTTNTKNVRSQFLTFTGDVKKEVP